MHTMQVALKEKVGISWMALDKITAKTWDCRTSCSIASTETTSSSKPKADP